MRFFLILAVGLVFGLAFGGGGDNQPGVDGPIKLPECPTCSMDPSPPEEECSKLCPPLPDPIEEPEDAPQP